MSSIRIAGFYELQDELQYAEFALEALLGIVGALTLDPCDPESIEAAIRKIDTAESTAEPAGASHPLATKLVETAKDHYRSQVQVLALRKS